MYENTYKANFKAESQNQVSPQKLNNQAIYAPKQLHSTHSQKTDWKHQ